MVTGSPIPQSSIFYLENTMIYDMGGRHDTFTGGFADAQPTTERLQELGYDAEMVSRQFHPDHVSARLQMFRIYSVETNAPKIVVMEAMGWRFTPEYFQRLVKKLLESRD